MLLWDGACEVHERFSVEGIKQLKQQHTNAKVLVHPECTSEVAALADKIGSTSALLKYCINNDAKEFIVVTEPGILYECRSLHHRKHSSLRHLLKNHIIVMSVLI